MPHEYAGKYRTKHPAGTTYDPAIAAALTARAEDGKISCADAHAIAGESGAAPAEVGRTADLLELRVHHCQMGLFGYSPEKRLVKPAAAVSEELGAFVAGAATEGRIDCLSCWEIARSLGMAKMAVADACERLGLKVRRCQLGAF
jgi:hypothetical protein